MPRKSGSKGRSGTKPEAAPGTLRLEGQVALITGGNRGLGLAFARVLAREGCAVVIAGRNERELSRAAKSLAPLGSGILTHHCDVRDERSIAQMFTTVKEQFGRLDVLINNAGVAHESVTAEKLSVKSWRATIDTNLTGTFLVTQAALSLMSRGATIVNNLSVAARTAFANMSAYNASKFGALGFTEALRLELQPRGIRVIALMPGATATDIWDQFWPNAPRAKMLRPESVAEMLLSALLLSPTDSVTEISISPAAGPL